MSHRPARRAADLVCRAVLTVLPPDLQPWGWAIRHEVASIADDRQALRFALGSACGLLPRALLGHLLRPFIAAPRTNARSSGGMTTMNFGNTLSSRPRTVGVACAMGSVLLGIGYMATAGAPIHYLGVNAGALVLGLAMLPLVGALSPREGPMRGAGTVTMALLLLATALLGARIDGAARWVQFGALYLQPSLILLPAIIVGFARSRNAASTLGIVIAAAALALQPDRAMAGMLAAGLAVLTAMQPDRFTLPALAASVAAFLATLLQPDRLPAMPYVDQILYSAFDVHALAGVAVLGGSALLIVPAIAGGRSDAEHRAVYWVFGIVWLVAVIAAALGNYPTPIVGYGGSPVLGYMLSLALLPRRAATRPIGAEGARREIPAARPSDTLRVGLA